MYDRKSLPFGENLKCTSLVIFLNYMYIVQIFTDHVHIIKSLEKHQIYLHRSMKIYSNTELLASHLIETVTIHTSEIKHYQTASPLST